MGYSTIIEVDQVLPQAITSARPDATGDKLNLINVPGANPSNPVGVNRIPDTVVEFYITLADSQIDGILSQMYATPLKKCSLGEWQVVGDIDEYNQLIELSTSCNLVAGNEIIIRDDNTGIEETHTVQEIIDQYYIQTLEPILNSYTGDEVRVMRIAFPPPVNQISARYAASFIYDKYFAAQNDPNLSEYGKEMRTIAMGQLNDILNGKVILYCQQRIGDRFGNPWLDDTYQHRDRGYNTSERNMSLPK